MAHNTRQNIPRADKDRFKLRGAFIPEKGKDLIVGDYEQLEMRLLGCASGERKMIQLFLDGKDIHMGNAQLVFGEGIARKFNRAAAYDYDDFVRAKDIEKKVKAKTLLEEALTDEIQALLNYRQAVKIIGFGLNYGMKENKMAADMTGMGIPTTREEALELMNQYLETYPGVRAFFDEAVEETRLTGYAFTFLGRRRFLPEIASLKDMERFQAERQAGNTQIQGTAADVAKMAMILCDEAQLDKRYGCEMLLQVHDELVFECPEETSEEAQAEIKEWMEHPFATDMDVPLAVSIGRGKTWLSAK